MFNVLFWNLHRNEIEDYIIESIVDKDIDVAIFSEFVAIDFNKIVKETGFMYRQVEGIVNDKKITMLSKYSVYASVLFQESRYNIYSVKTSINDYLIVGIHLEDRDNYTTADRVHTIQSIVSDIENIEEDYKCQNTIVIGDFNANLFDEELLSKYAFNAVLFKKIIEKNEYTNPESYRKKRFYNPILNCFSEQNLVYGSYYYSNDSITPYWYFLDQVLVRKPLVDSLKTVEYIKGVRHSDDLLKNDIPNGDISDHLPLFVEIKEA